MWLGDLFRTSRIIIIKWEVSIFLCHRFSWLSHSVNTMHIYIYMLYPGKPGVTILYSKLSEVTVYPNKYAHGLVVLCFVVAMQSFIMNSHEVFIHIHQGCFAGTGAIVRLPQCQWSKPDGYGKISQCITTTKHSIKQKPCAYFLGYTVDHKHYFRLFAVIPNILLMQTYMIWRHWMYIEYITLSQFFWFSFMHQTGLCVISWPISFVMIVKIGVIYLMIIIKSKIWFISHCVALGHGTMVCAVYIAVFFVSLYLLSISAHFLHHKLKIKISIDFCYQSGSWVFCCKQLSFSLLSIF